MINAWDIEKIKADKIQLEKENVKLKDKLESTQKALRNLVKKLDEINDNKEYRCVWDLAFAHGHSYTGPQYDKELDAARNLLRENNEINSKGSC